MRIPSYRRFVDVYVKYFSDFFLAPMGGISVLLRMAVYMHETGFIYVTRLRELPMTYATLLTRAVLC